MSGEKCPRENVLGENLGREMTGDNVQIPAFLSIRICHHGPTNTKAPKNIVCLPVFLSSFVYLISLLTMTRRMRLLQQTPNIPMNPTKVMNAPKTTRTMPNGVVYALKSIECSPPSIELVQLPGCFSTETTDNKNSQWIMQDGTTIGV